MKIVQFNAYEYGSTGRIALAISDMCAKNSIECTNFFVFRKKRNLIRLIRQKGYAFIAKITGEYGFVANKNSKELIQLLKKQKPDILLLHNFHDHSLNVGVLFKYLSSTHINVIMDFHDCWAFTGYCCHYSFIKCEKWKTLCAQCPLRKKVSWFFDKSTQIFEMKKELFTNSNISIICSSNWMKNQVSQSFLKMKDIQIINYPLDCSRFRPLTEKPDQFLPLSNRKIVLGVAFDWGLNKGLEDFNYLADKLPYGFQVVVVGVTNKERRLFNPKIILIPRVSSPDELAKLYSCSSVYVNATREETFGMTSIEAQACGTPVVAYNICGCPDAMSSATGVLVKPFVKQLLLEAVIRVCQSNSFSAENCRKFALSFDAGLVMQRYLDYFRKRVSEAHE